MISIMSVHICNRYYARRANSRKMTTFRGYPSLTVACTGLLERRWSWLWLLKSTLSGKNFMCRMSWSICSLLRCNLLKIEMRVATSNHEKFTKTPYFWFSRLLAIIDVDIQSSSPVLVMISGTSMLICNHFHAIRADSGKITSFLWGCIFFAPSFVGTPFTQWHEILSRNTRDFRLSYGGNLNFLSHVGLNRYRVVTDGQTESL